MSFLDTNCREGRGPGGLTGSKVGLSLLSIEVARYRNFQWDDPWTLEAIASLLYVSILRNIVSISLLILLEVP